jgi:hypothetical protein
VQGDKVKIELLLNPFCLCERDFCRLRDICEKLHLQFDTYNLWDIADEDVDALPSHLSGLIKEWRRGQRPGSVYSNAFINGERIPINDWPKSFDVIEAKIIAALGEGEK